ncbi:hypothetical protein IFM89_030627 [Coptis chinensis]|uniref:Pentatricopeptide repeat-containing protein n=1 Tax=Coptis chinensis TaxID=261450 RepID=A0A835LTF1_9MAGN|nr:hypothetical protein IFM89_030627 [Coptis chinensis]
MWRSNYLIRYSKQAAHLIRNQVQRSLLHLSILHSQNPRFFSNDQNQILDVISPELEHPLGNFDENDPFSIFDESPGPGFNIEESVERDEQQVVDQVEEIDREEVERVLSVLQSSLDGSLESSLNKLDVTINEDFMVRVIETPLVPGDSLIRFYKWGLKRYKLKTSTRVVDSLVRAFGTGIIRKRDVYALWDLVKEIGENDVGVLSTGILNEVISLFWKLGKGKAALEVLNKFEDFVCEPNVDSYYLTIEALCRRSIYDWAWPVCEKMLNAGDLPDSKKIGSIISSFCKGNKAKDAHLVYLMVKEKNKCPPRTVVNFLITSLCKEDDTVKLALELLNDFSGDARKYAIKPFSCVIRGLCRIKDIEEAKKVLSKMIDEGPPPGSAVFNSIINGLSKAGDLDEAMGLLKVMETRGLRPDVYTYSVLMSGYVKGGQMDEARSLLSEAKKKHEKLCPVTFHILTRGYCKLEEFDKAVELLNEMKDYGVYPNADEYNKMIQSLCNKALDWRTAEKLFEDMKEKGLYLNGITQSLIRAVKELEEEDVLSIDA